MSFGYWVGDFIAMGQLTWTIYRSCKSAPGEFQELSRELSSLHTILHELEDEARTPSSLLNRRGSGRKVELDGVLANLSGVLKQTEDMVTRYNSLGRDQKRTGDRVRLATENLSSLRSTLTFHTNAINLFMSSLSTGALVRIETTLDDLVRDIRAGRRELSVMSSATGEENDEISWEELERELVCDGITRQDMEKYKEEIKEYLRKLILEDAGMVVIGTAAATSLAVNLKGVSPVLRPLSGSPKDKSYPTQLRKKRIISFFAKSASFDSPEDTSHARSPIEPGTGSHQYPMRKIGISLSSLEESIRTEVLHPDPVLDDPKQDHDIMLQQHELKPCQQTPKPPVSRVPGTKGGMKVRQFDSFVSRLLDMSPEIAGPVTPIYINLREVLNSLGIRFEENPSTALFTKATFNCRATLTGKGRGHLGQPEARLEVIDIISADVIILFTPGKWGKWGSWVEQQHQSRISTEGFANNAHDIKVEFKILLAKPSLRAAHFLHFQRVDGDSGMFHYVKNTIVDQSELNWK